MIYRPLVAALCVAAALATGACSGSVSIGTKQVDKSDVAKQISTELEAKFGEAPDSVTCPDNLKAEVDATLTCTLEIEGSEFDVATTVTKVDGSDVLFDIKVADTPNN